MATVVITIIGRYEVDADNYEGEVSAAKMAEIDQDSFESGEVSIYDVLEWVDARDLIVKFKAE